jgi:hypothetical protein
MEHEKEKVKVLITHLIDGGNMPWDETPQGVRFWADVVLKLATMVNWSRDHEYGPTRDENGNHVPRVRIQSETPGIVMADELNSAFSWDTTPQGNAYWSQVYDALVAWDDPDVEPFNEFKEFIV